MGNRTFAAILALLISVGVAAWPTVTQTSVAHGVTVAVTAGNLSPESGIWDFALAYDSRMLTINDSVLDTVVLVGDGATIKPLAWEGDQAGGRHRVGVLKFVAMQPRPKQLELRVMRPGESRPRVFRFAFGEWAA